MTSASRSPVTVSIITPCYNGARFLADTLRSAAGQSRPPLEILVIDDGSTDESARIAEEFGPPVRVIRQPNQGESVARNRGLSEAKGTHVLFLDADDLLDREAVAHLAAALDAAPDAVALMGCRWFTSDPASPHTVKEAFERQFFPEIIESNFAPPLCWLAPLHLVQRAGGFCETLRWFEDWDLWWRVGLQEPLLIPVPYIGARYRQHPDSQLATTSPANRARGHVALITRMAEAFLQKPALIERHGDRLFWSAWTALRRAREAGVDWIELRPLGSSLRQLASRGPASITESWTARAVRLLGTRTAASLRGAAMSR